jgi:hypothetical protein
VARPKDVSTAQLLLAEYQNIKEEQRARIGFRDNLLYVTLVAVTAVVVSSAQDRHVALLLVMPPVSLVLGWTYLVNDEKISAIGRYVRNDLGPRLALLSGTPADSEVFHWESVHRADRRRASRKRIQLAVDIIAFCLVPLTALTTYWVSRRITAYLGFLSVAEALALFGLAYQMVLYTLPNHTRIHRTDP